MESSQIVCPQCNSNRLTAKYEAKYVYSYIIDSNAPGLKNKDELLPFLYDNREQVEARQYIKCESCGKEFPCLFSTKSNGIDYNDLRNILSNKNNLQSDIVN
jgi:DNA-directed RNA polymerase subunit RPC12/RpoP